MRLRQANILSPVWQPAPMARAAAPVALAPRAPHADAKVSYLYDRVPSEPPARPSVFVPLDEGFLNGLEVEYAKLVHQEPPGQADGKGRPVGQIGTPNSDRGA